MGKDCMSYLSFGGKLTSRCPESGVTHAALYTTNSLSVQAAAQVPNRSRLPSLCFMSPFETGEKKPQHLPWVRTPEMTLVWSNEVVPDWVNVFPRGQN